jgi:hypothetical protein
MPESLLERLSRCEPEGEAAEETAREEEGRQMNLSEEDKRWLSEQFATKADLERHAEHLVERMRDMQTEILRGFEAHSGAMMVRLRKVEADHGNLDTAASTRMEILERRLFEIEKRLGI